MRPFKYQSFTDTRAIWNDFKSNPNGRFLAGGTGLIDLMKLEVETPERLIDLSHLKWKGIHDLGHSIEVGALVTNNEMAHHPLIKTNFPFLSEALLSGASVQLRNLATASGNLLQRTRCAYFRDLASKCNKRVPGSGCPAFNGANRMHAIFGGGENCIATHPSDMCVPLMAMDAIVLTEQAKENGGARQISLHDFYKLPAENPSLENCLQKGELITGLRLPKQSLFKKSRYIKIRDRASYAFALVSAAVAVQIKDRKIQDLKMAFGGVGTMPWRSLLLERELVGAVPSKANIEKALEIMMSEAKPRQHNGFKQKLLRQTVIRAFSEMGALI